MKKSILFLTLITVSLQEMCARAIATKPTNRQTSRTPMYKVIFLLMAFVLVGGMVVGQTRATWRTDGPSDGKWEWGSTCEPAGDGQWFYNDWGGFRKRPDCFGTNDVYFDGNGINTMNLNTSDYSVKSVFFTVNATSARTLNADGSLKLILKANNGDPKIENNSSATHTFNVPIQLDNWAQINPISGNLTFSGAITNNGNFINVYGSNSKVLTISGNLTGTGGISLKQNSKIIFSSSAKAFTGATVIEAGNIETSVSLSSSLITVKSGAKLTITGTDVTIPALTIESGGVVEVQAGKSLTVTGALTNSATETGLVIKSDVTGTGSLKNSSTNVSATFERYMNNADWLTAKDGWHFLSSPVASQAISPNFVTTPDTEYDFYCWYEPSNLWVNYKNTVTAPTWNTANGSLNFTVGKGYMAAYNTEGTKVFSGTLNVTDVPIAGLTITGTSQANRSWHLLGNPFACAITWDATAAWNLTNIAGIANIWNEATQSYTPITSVVPMAIPATNGFMVQASGGTGSLTIPASKRDHAAQAFYKSSTVIPQITLVAKTADGTSEQISKVMVYADATEGFDLMYDGEFLPGFAPLFYSKLGDLNLSVNCLPNLPAESLIPFGFVKNDATNFSIELKESMEGYEVFLKDLKTNTDQNLTENPVYTFTSEAGDDANRFLLHFLSTVGTTEPSCPEALRIYANAGNIYLSGNTGKAEVYVRNMIGQTVIQRSVNGDALKVINATNLKVGVYIVSVVNNAQTISTKVIIK